MNSHGVVFLCLELVCWRIEEKNFYRSQFWFRVGQVRSHLGRMFDAGNVRRRRESVASECREEEGGAWDSGCRRYEWFLCSRGRTTGLSG